MDNTIEKIQAEIYKVLHAIQSGVALEIERGSKDTQPKHLRVGVNNALCEIGAIGGLLIKKGIVTEEEYFTAILEALQKELAIYHGRNPGCTFV